MRLVIKDIKEEGTYIGVPAQIMNKAEILGGYIATQLVHIISPSVLTHSLQRRRAA